MRDRISQQPDEILVQILSLLRLKEAGRTSVLSRRWKDLWKLTTSLIFEPSKLLEKVMNNPREREKRLPAERLKFVTWVNQVLTLHESPSLDKLRFVFSLDGSFSKEIDEWIKLIIPKRVKVLEIFLFMNICRRHGEYYGFSQEAFKSLLKLSSLTSLSLDSVHVDGEFVNHLISNCPNLERLFISNSRNHSKLKVAGKFVQLKYLEIHLCCFESIELSAPKLGTFRWFGSRFPDSNIGSNPLLSELVIRGDYGTEVTSVMVPFSSHLQQLTTLSLKMWFCEQWQVIPQIPVLRNLKHLVLDFWIYKIASLIRFTKFIAAAPFLVKFTLKLQGQNSHRGMGMETEPCSHPHQCLKEVEIQGFYGNNCDFELVKYLAKNAIRLEKMVIDHLHPSERREREWDIGNRMRQTRERVNVLKRMLPPGAKLFLVLV